jgi:ribosome biogenesis protein UTP30
MAPVTTVATRSSTETPYKLDPEQTLRASRALLEHLKREAKRIEASAVKKELLKTVDGEDDEDEGSTGDQTPVWLNVTCKQHIVDRNCLRPSKVRVPHSLNTAKDLSICLITADPQRAVKNIVANPVLPTELSSRIERVIGLSKLKARYKTFESRRELLAQHDVFLADDRIVTRLPGLLGKVFYKGTSKRPISITIANLEEKRQKRKDKASGSSSNKKSKEKDEAQFNPPDLVAKEIYRALESVPISLKQGLNASARIALVSFTPEQLAENVDVVVKHIVERHVVKGWRNVKAIHIKSPNSMAMPIWLAEELWTEDSKVEATEENAALEAPPSALKRKRNPNTVKGPQAGQRKKVRVEQDGEEGSENEKENVRADEARKQKLKKQKQKAFRSEITV